MVNAVFACVVTNLFISYPASVLPVFIQIPLALWIGHAVYKRKRKMLVPSLAALAVMYITAIIASKVDFLQIDLVKYIGDVKSSSKFILNAVNIATFL